MLFPAGFPSCNRYSAAKRKRSSKSERSNDASLLASQQWHPRLLAIHRMSLGRLFHFAAEAGLLLGLPLAISLTNGFPAARLNAAEDNPDRHRDDNQNDHGSDNHSE